MEKTIDYLNSRILRFQTEVQVDSIHRIRNNRASVRLDCYVSGGHIDFAGHEWYFYPN